MTGLVETKFRDYAKKKRKDPAKYMAELVESGVTQSALADQLGCTRQAVGRIAKKYGVSFPGCEIDIDAVALSKWGSSFDNHVNKNPDQRYVDMAAELGVSLSTFKRRVKQMGINRRTSAA
jgi:hypothetical protein